MYPRLGTPALERGNTLVVLSRNIHNELHARINSLLYSRPNVYLFMRIKA